MIPVNTLLLSVALNGLKTDLTSLKYILAQVEVKRGWLNYPNVTEYLLWYDVFYLFGFFFLMTVEDIIILMGFTVALIEQAPSYHDTIYIYI